MIHLIKLLLVKGKVIDIIAKTPQVQTGWYEPNIYMAKWEVIVWKHNGRPFSQLVTVTLFAYTKMNMIRLAHKLAFDVWRLNSSLVVYSVPDWLRLGEGELWPHPHWQWSPWQWRPLWSPLGGQWHWWAKSSSAVSVGKPAGRRHWSAIPHVVQKGIQMREICWP